MNFLLVFLIVSFSSVSNADNWAFNFQAETDLSYNDNVTMTNNPQESVIYRVLPTLSASYQNEVSEINANASYGTERYIDIDGFDFILQEYNIQSIFHTETTDFGLSADYQSRPHLDTAQEDSGDFNTSSIQTTATIRPFFSYHLTDIDDISIAGGYTKRTSTELDFSDIDSSDIRLTWIRQWTEIISSNVEVFYENFEFDESSSNTVDETINDNYGANFSSTVLITERFSIAGGIGVRHTNTEEKFRTGGSTKRTSNGFLTAITVNYKGDSLDAKFTVNRALVPSSRGELNEQSSLILKLDYKITETVSASFIAGYLQNDRESTRANEVERKRTNINASPSVNWRATEHLFLSASYTYRFQDDSENTFTANSNLFMLSANFNYGYD